MFFLLKQTRQNFFSYAVLKLFHKFKLLPKISETEEEALKAGTISIDRELFSGSPDTNKILKQKIYQLTEEEQEFIDVKVEKLCSLTNDWQIYKKRDLNDEVWQFLKKEKFFSFIIPKEYGGLGFSKTANSIIVQKLATRSQVLAITAMVPNSLGPGELLIHYGTERQKKLYLPKLAKGEEIPCFALTEEYAGSDASAINASALVFEENNEIKIKLNWRKRYITLGPIATLIGLAFYLYDPENLLKKGTEPMLTCALIKSDLKGITQKERHDPLFAPFMNGPLIGEDVIISVEDIIGEASGIGKGWMMLMQSLAVGRGISLPAVSLGAMQLSAYSVFLYSNIRKQFNIELNKFEAIREKLAKIYGLTYLFNAANLVTSSIVDQGERPAIINAIMKYHATEAARSVINDSMDIEAGHAIIRGEHNLLAHLYTSTPIGITVEGANIMTRSLIQFGQGLIRLHPYLYYELQAIKDSNVKEFDKLLVRHIIKFASNIATSIAFSFTRARLINLTSFSLESYYRRKINWVSSRFAAICDLLLIKYGGNLKIKERMTAKMADILSWMYLVSSVMIIYEKKKNDSLSTSDEVYTRWCLYYGFDQIQKSFEEIYDNLPGLQDSYIAFLIYLTG